MRNELFLNGQNEGFATRLLHQQCWCWGCDIRSKSGNLLIQRGCIRHRPPAEGLGSTCYEMSIEAKQKVLIWGFGMAFLPENGSGIFVHRNHFRPKILAIKSILPWTAAELELSEPQGDGAWFKTLNLLRRSTEWVMEYEIFIAQTMGTKYRKRCLRSFHELAQNHRSSTVEQWRFVNTQLTELLCLQAP